MEFLELSKNTEKQISENAYPGRGIIIGLTPDKQHMVQIYWIMGRSENSRNRVFEVENQSVRTKAYDESKVIDPSLIIYYPIKNYKSFHIVSNGDQSDTIFNYISVGNTFEEALFTREFEPDEPNYTPRISGLIDSEDKKNSYKLSILKSTDNNPLYCQRIFFNYETAIPGYGHCIHTYEGDGNPVPSFKGEPKLVSLFNGIEENLQHYWNLLNQDNKISLLVKYVNVNDKGSLIKTVNKNI